MPPAIATLIGWLRARLAACLFATGLTGLALSATASASPAPCPDEFGSIGPNGPAACWRPYGAGSPFNRELPPDPVVASDSATIISNLVANHVDFAGGGSDFAFTTGDGRDAVYYSQSGDPMVRIHCTYEWGPRTCTGSDGVNIDGKLIPVPRGAQPAGGVDRHMTVIDQAAGREYDFEHATWDGDRILDVWSGGGVAIGPNAGTGLGGGATASDFATFAGLITERELAADAINHALVASVPCTDGSVAPAVRPNGFSCAQLGSWNPTGTPPPLGALLQLTMTDDQIAATRAPAWERTIMTAMAHYGMYVNDTNGSDGGNAISVEAESDVSYTSLGERPLMAGFMKRAGGTYYAPLQRWILTGPFLSLKRLRVISPCFGARACGPAPLARSARVHGSHRRHRKRAARRRHRHRLHHAHRRHRHRLHHTHRHHAHRHRVRAHRARHARRRL